MRRLIFLLLMAVATGHVVAQTLSVNAPTHVSLGENFRLTYTVNTQNASDFHVGNVPDALEIITGPYTSSQSSFQMVNGHTSSSSSITYTFILCANKNGTFIIPPATVSAGGKTVSSKPVKVTVSGTAQQSNGAPRMHDDNDDKAAMRAAGTPISDKDLFIKVTASKRRVREQEPILLTYKVYTLVDLTSLNGDMPDLTGFHTQEIPLPAQKSFHVEYINGRSYRCVTWKQYVMYPQMTGNLEIPSIIFDGTVIQQNRNVDPFEAFFNGGSGYVEVKRSIKAPGVTIQVDSLPRRPANYSGGVGRLNISAQLNKNEVKANDPVSIRVVISGMGNLKLIKQPVINFPKDFDKYDPKVTDKTQLTTNGVEGNMIYDFLAVPRNQGNYTIPPIEFVYFDTGAGSYKTLRTEAFSLTVEKGSGSGSSDDYMADLENQDIRPIHRGSQVVYNNSDYFFGSVAYSLLLVILLALFVALLVIFRKRAIDRANISKMRGQKANKVAARRLRQASKLMAEHRQSEFYDEVLKALWGYVGDKLNIPIEQLSKDNISDRLSERSVDEATIGQFITALDECEFERYAPGDTAGNMSKTYDTAVNAIMKIEECMKNTKKTAKANKAVLLILLLSVSASAGAISKKNADDEYLKGNYQQAIKDYEELLSHGASADLYYNLGNAYYKTDNITRAVINYERALMISPADKDVRYNLQMARSKTIDKITPASEMFFVTWYHSAVNMLSVDSWAILALVALSVALLLLLVYLFVDHIMLRKIGFFGGVALLAIFIISNFFAWQQKQTMLHRVGAIVVSPSAGVKTTPAETDKDAFVIHEGTRVDIIEDSMKDWKEIQLDDGRSGWIMVSQLEKI